MKSHLPPPSPQALAHSRALATRLIERMHNQSLSFIDFMDASLYEPGYGYYAAGSTKFGEAGDFVTAPLISSHFGATLARATYPVISQHQGAYLELGAGNGQMARDILKWLTQQNDFTTQYYILEVSPDCRAQQQETLKEYLGRVHWLDTLPKLFKGVMLANEVLDALPVALFQYREGLLFERRVSHDGQQFIWVEEPLRCPIISHAMAALDLPAALKENYCSEINPTLPMFIHSLLDSIVAGQIILIDYGFLRDTYYHPDRVMGTLMCHYRHHAHSDPFLYPGLQDITAHVDFTTVGLAAQQAGAQVELYTQAEYLLKQGLLTEVQASMENANPLVRARLSSAIQKLVQPQEMGELFKVMVITKVE
jgi:SAM-dependent MidA family methyltransferase